MDKRAKEEISFLANLIDREASYVKLTKQPAWKLLLEDLGEIRISAINDLLEDKESVAVVKSLTRIINFLQLIGTKSIKNLDDYTTRLNRLRDDILNSEKVNEEHNDNAFTGQEGAI